MVFSVAGLDVLYTLSTGVQASHAVTDQIEFNPEGTGILGWMQELGRTLDRMGSAAFGRYAPLVELLLYGMATPLLVAMPLAGEAQRKRWPRSAAVVVLGLAALGIGAWLGWKYPDPSAVYYALVNVTLRASHVVGVSYYTGSLLSFIILPLLVAFAYGGVLIWRSGPETTRETQKGSPDPSLPTTFREVVQKWRLWNVPAIGAGTFVTGLLVVAGVAHLVVSYELSLTYTYWEGAGIASESYRANTALGHACNLGIGASALGVGIVSLSLFAGFERAKDILHARTPGRLTVFALSVLSHVVLVVAWVGERIAQLLYLQHTGEKWVGIVPTSQIAGASPVAASPLLMGGAALLTTTVLVALIAGPVTVLSDAPGQLFERSPGITCRFGHTVLHGIIWIGILLDAFFLFLGVLSGNVLTPAALIWSLYAALCLRAMEARHAQKAVATTGRSSTE
jgi:hypothetical protein